MKNNTAFYSIALLSLVLLSACATLNNSDFAQRKYLDGVYTTQFKNQPKGQLEVNSLPQATQPMVASVHNSAVGTFGKADDGLSNMELPVFDSLFDELGGCEKLLLKNGDVELIKVTEVNATTIKYKRCKDGKTRGVTFVANKHDIYYILHADGTKETFTGEGKKVEENAGGFGCDEIMLKNGDVEYVKVTEVNSEAIKYKRCHDGGITGITFVAKKKDIVYLKYANGYKETFGNSSATTYYEGTDVEIKESKKLKSGVAIALVSFLLGILVLWIVLT
jgi:hypothetical protein